MKGKTEGFLLAGRQCGCFVPEGGKQGLPLCVLCGWHMEELVPQLAAELPECLLFWAEADGSRDYTPWPVPPIWEGETFSGGAAEYLTFLLETALPELEKRYQTDPARRALLGYSLGGLFCLWAMGQRAPFRAFGSLSGSTWYEGFLEELRAAPLTGDELVYLSLGDREEFGGPPRMRAVGDCTRQTRELLEPRVKEVTLEWNKGGHGKGVQNRWKKALLWITERM